MEGKHDLREPLGRSRAKTLLLGDFDDFALCKVRALEGHMQGAALE
jgi:hypothetical protein